MIIHQPEITIKDGKLRVSAQVETVNQRGELPETFWYAFPESYVDYMTDRSDGFLSALFVLAMYLGEDVEVQGTVSPQLAYNVEGMMLLYQRLSKKILQPVAIQYEHMEAMRPEETAEAVGMSFSGGIDSYYTLWRNLLNNEPNPALRVTHGLHIHGLDYFLSEQGVFDALYPHYDRTFKNLGLTLLTAESNMLHFYRNRVPWDVGHAGPLFGAVQVLGRLFSRYYKPSSDELINGRLFFNMYSTESLHVSIHAPSMLRLEKLEQLKDWQAFSGRLHVCANDKKRAGGMACYRCQKCLNTLVYLDLLGIRKRFSDFPEPLTFGKFLRLGWATPNIKYYESFLPTFLIRSRRYGLLALFWLMYFPNRFRFWLKRGLAAIIPKSWLYKLKQYFIPVETARKLFRTP